MCIYIISIFFLNGKKESEQNHSPPFKNAYGPLIKNLPANAGDIRYRGSIPRLGQSRRVRSGNPLQYSCLGNSMDRGAWWATVHGVTKNWT